MELFNADIPILRNRSFAELLRFLDDSPPTASRGKATFSMQQNPLVENIIVQVTRSLDTQPSISEIKFKNQLLL